MSKFRKVFINIFITTIIFGAFGFGVFEKFISTGFNESSYKDHPLFKDDTRRVRDQDFWPFSSYPMFSDGYHNPKVSRIEARGVTEAGEEVVMQISQVFYPLWENGLHRMLKKAVVHHKDYTGVLDNLSDLFIKRFQSAKAPEYRQNEFPKLTKINWFIQLWDWEEWLNFRKSHENLHKWKDFKKSKYSPLYHKIIHTSVLKAKDQS